MWRLIAGYLTSQVRPLQLYSSSLLHLLSTFLVSCSDCTVAVGLDTEFSEVVEGSHLYHPKVFIFIFIFICIFSLFLFVYVFVFVFIFIFFIF